jgi:tetratricopeptide (TPR) repeat protein
VPADPAPAVLDPLRELHRRAVEEASSGRPAAAARLLRAGLRQLGRQPGGRGDVPELTARFLGSLAVAEVYVGHSGPAFELLDEADGLVPPEDRGILVQQRGLLLYLVGRMDEALHCLDEALPLLGRARDRTVRARTLLNRALLHQTAGRIASALADLDECERLARQGDQPRLVAKAMHGRGACQLLTGDIPAALRAFDIAGRAYAEHAVGWIPVVAMDKARALLSAGLYAEAIAELDLALALFPAVRMNQEHAEAELTRAQAALAVGDPVAARRWARRAARRFARRGNAAWAAVATLTGLRADLAQDRRPAHVAVEAAELAERLRALGLRHDAELADVLTARAHLVLGHHERARAYLPPVDRTRARLETRLLRRLTLAELAAARGEHRQVLAQARAGLNLLQDHRGRFGSLDAVTGTAALGSELARIALAAALERGRPSGVFGCAERARAQAFRVRPIRPPADPMAAEAVAELRQLARRDRVAELAGKSDLTARRRCAELEKVIRARGWQLPGTGERYAEATFGQVRAELAGAGCVLVNYLPVEGRLGVLALGRRGPRLVGLGGLRPVSEAVAMLHSDLDALCVRRLPAAVVSVIRDSVRRRLAELAELLLTPLERCLGDAGVVIVPTGPLSGLPWGLLPPLRGRPVTVAPSASAWLAARSARRAGPAGGRCLLVAGPDLAHADDEVELLAKIYGESTVLTGGAATVPATLAALGNCSSVHFAAHGHHEPQNVLFSRLDLADGPLMVHDIHQLAHVPQHVVLSSCDVGRTVVRVGDEIMGFTAALLYSGTATVVSSVARVDDDASVAVMSTYHRAVAEGTPPAQALAAASLLEPLMPLICFGAG